MTPKEYKEMMAHLTRPSRIKVAQLDNVNTPDLDQTPDSILRPGETLEDFDVTFRRPNADGGRVPFSKGNMPLSVAIEEVVKEKGTNFKSKKNLQTLLEGKIGYKPNIESLVPSKYPSLKNFIYEESQKPFTNEELKNILGDDLKKFKAQGLTDREIRDRASDRKIYKNLPAEKKQKKLLKEQKRKATRSIEQVALENEKAALRMQERRGNLPTYHKGRKAENRLWSDFIRSAESKDGYFKFKNFVPKEGKKYNKAETQAITLVDRKGNEFKFKSLIDDINKFSGYKADDVLLPYKQVEFLYTQGLTKELNKLANIKPRARQALFNVQHIDGIARNPFNVMLTFADQNIAEAGSKRTFDATFKYLLENKRPYSEKKAAVKKFYSSLGPDIATKLGKKEVGTRPTFKTLLDKSGVKLTNEQGEALNKFMADLAAKIDPDGCGRKPSASGGRIGLRFGSSTCALKAKKRLDQIILKGTKDKSEQLLATQILKTGRVLKDLTSIRGLLGPAALVFTAATEAGLIGADMLMSGKTFKETIADSLINPALGPKLKQDSKKLFVERLKNLGFSDQEIGKGLMFDKMVEDVETLDDLEQRKAIADQKVPQAEKFFPTVLDKRKKEASDIAMDIQDIYRTRDRNVLDAFEGKFQKPETQELFQEAADQKAFLEDLVAADRKRAVSKNIYGKYFQGERSRKKDEELISQYFDMAREDANPAFDIPGARDVTFIPGKTTGGLFGLAGGGIAKLAGIDQGPPPVRGPNPQGLPSLLKRVRNR